MEAKSKGDRLCDILELALQGVIILLCIGFSFALYWYRRDGSASFLTLLSNSPLGNLATNAAKAITGVTAKAQTPDGETATVQATTDDKT